MDKQSSYTVVGLRPDGTVGIRLFSNEAATARSLADFVRGKNPDWNVLIEKLKPVKIPVAT